MAEILTRVLFTCSLESVFPKTPVASYFAVPGDTLWSFSFVAQKQLTQGIVSSWKHSLVTALVIPLFSGFPSYFWCFLCLVASSSTSPVFTEVFVVLGLYPRKLNFSGFAHCFLGTSCPHWFRPLPVLRTKPPRWGTWVCLTREPAFHFPTKIIPHKMMLSID